MQQENSAQFTLFDLLARKWDCPHGVLQALFNKAETAVVFRAESGRLSMAELKDAESPETRMKTELDTGRATIQPRSNPVPPLRPIREFKGADIPAVALDQGSFAAVSAKGGLYQITPGGQAVRRLAAKRHEITAIASTEDGSRLLVAKGNDIASHGANDMASTWQWVAPHAVTSMVLSPDSNLLAMWGDQKLTIYPFGNLPEREAITVTCEGTITSMTWDESNELLACACEEHSIYTIDMREGRLQNRNNYPAPVRAVDFSKPARALVTSGAYRAVGWDSDELPTDRREGAPLKIGRSGFVPLSYVAAHPTKTLVASGYSSGLLTIAQIGSEQEMMVHQEREAPVSSLSWAASGNHLAVGYSNGCAAIVTFPEQMFKN